MINTSTQNGLSKTATTSIYYYCGFNKLGFWQVFSWGDHYLPSFENSGFKNILGPYSYEEAIKICPIPNNIQKEEKSEMIYWK